MKRKGILIAAFFVAAGTFALSADSMPTLSWFIDNTWWQAEPHWGSSIITKELQQELGLTVDATNPSEDKGEKLNIMLAAGVDLPDIITESDSVRWSRLVQSKAILPLDGYMNKLPNLKETVSDSVLKLLREPDGKVYSLPFIFATKAWWGKDCLMYNQGLYEKMGSPSVATFDDFEAALKKAKTLKNVDGKPVVPLSMSSTDGILGSEEMENMLAGFGVLSTNFSSGNGLIAFDPKTGPYNVTKSDGFRKSIMLFNKWYSEGLIDREAFIQTFDQLKSKVLNQEVAFALRDWQGTDIWGQYGNQMEKAKNQYWGMRPPVDKSFKGEYKNVPFAPSPSGHTAITAKSKNIDAALKYLNFCTSKRGQFMLWEGYDPDGKFKALEGVCFDRIGTTNKLKFTDAWFKEKDAIGHMGLRNKYGRFWNNPITSQDIQAEYEFVGDRDSLEKMSLPWVWDGSLAVNLDPKANSPELPIFQKCKTIANTAVVKIILTPNAQEASKLFDRMLSDLKDAGIDKLETVWKENYQANVERLK
jgi:putative aldouronate transport system substrate-binding protein